MERKGGFNTLDEFLQSRDDLKMKLTRLKRSSNPFLKKLDPADRIKYWLALIPETFAERVRSFYRLMKLKNSVKVFTRHKVVVDYDTLFLAKQINKADRGEDFELITNARLSMMRSVICLYLAFNRDFEYHRGWSHISYALISLGATEEETLLIFSHLVQNILPGFFKASDNNSARVRVIAEFHVLAERQKYSFCSLTRASIFTTHKEDSDTMETADTKTKAALFYNDSVKNFGLLTILKTTCDEWFGSLFSNILCPKDCLTFWDHLLIYNHRLLFKFGLILLTKVNGKLEQHIKKEKKGFVDLGIDAAQHHLVLMAPALKKQLTAYLHSNDFTSVLNGSFDRRDSTLVISQDKKTSNIVQELPALIFGARLKHFNDIKKELEANIPLDSGRVLTIFQIIDDFKADKVTAKEFVSALTTHSITYPGLAVKIFSMADQNLKGHLSKKDLKCFFAIIADGFERKLKLLWKELAKAPLIDPNEAIEMLQSIDSIIHYDSTIFDENLPLVYERMIRKIPENNVSVDSFMQFVRTDKVCIPLFKEFNVIDGKTPDDGVIETESDEEDIEKTEKTEQDLKFDKSRSQRGSSPTYGELMSSKGRNSYSRKSGLGFENMTGLKEEMTSEDAGQTNEPLSPSDKEGFISSIANTEENLPGLRPPAFVVKSPMMDPKKTRVSKLKF